MKDNIVISTSAGRCVGTCDEQDVIRFLNIPFATAQRWMPPQPMAPVDGVINTTTYGLAPIQAEPDLFFAKRNGDFTDVPTGEDCLNLNIWMGDMETPKKSVLFWVYGGSYIMGYNYKRYTLPEPFVKAHPEIMVVACNYRVGVLGSLNLSSIDPQGDYRYSNNLALLDIIAALRWTQDNIGAFGGDAGSVTLYGHSAGSNAISHLLAIPQAQPYFQKAICQSSFMTDLGAVALDTSQEIGEKFLELANVKTVEQALALTPQQVLDTQKQLFAFQYGGSKASKLFSPVEDELTVSSDAYGRMVRGETSLKALLIGTSEGEYDQMFLKKSVEESKEFVLQRNKDKQVSPSDLDSVLGLFPEITEKEAYMSVHNDLGLRLGGEWIARAYADKIPVYQYCFHLREPKEGWRAAHGAPCYYVFGSLVPENAPPELSRQMMNAWAAFCKSGDPNQPDITPWPLYTPDGPVMMIAQDWVVDSGYWKRSFHFWKERFAENKVLS